MTNSLQVQIYEELFLESFHDDMDGKKTIQEMLDILTKDKKTSEKFTLIMYDDANRPQILLIDDIIYYDIYKHTQLFNDKKEPILSRSYTDAHWHTLKDQYLFKIPYQQILENAKEINKFDNISTKDKQEATINIILEEINKISKDKKSNFLGLLYTQNKLPILLQYSNYAFKADKSLTI